MALNNIVFLFFSRDDNHLKDGQFCLNKTEITFVYCYLYSNNIAST